MPGIRVFAQGPGDFDHTATDLDGVFELPGLPRNPIHILLSRRQGKFQSETLAADRDRVEFTLRPEIVSPPHDQPEPPKDEPIPPGLRDRLTFVDLDTRGTDFLADGPAAGGNDLNRLPRGIHKLGETYFRIGEKMVHLKGRLRPELPQAVKGIKVQARGRMLHFLHSTQYGGDSSILIGAYVVHYADGSSERVPIAYGRSLVNWWKSSRTSEEPTEARVAWTGTNDATELNPGLKIRLFDMTWTNPHPDREIATLDVLSNGKDCDPFLVGSPSFVLEPIPVRGAHPADDEPTAPLQPSIAGSILGFEPDGSRGSLGGWPARGHQPGGTIVSGNNVSSTNRRATRRQFGRAVAGAAVGAFAAPAIVRGPEPEREAEHRDDRFGRSRRATT